MRHCQLRPALPRIRGSSPRLIPYYYSKNSVTVKPQASAPCSIIPNARVAHRCGVSMNAQLQVLTRLCRLHSVNPRHQLPTNCPERRSCGVIGRYGHCSGELGTWSWLPTSMRVGWRHCRSSSSTRFRGPTGSEPRTCQKSPAAQALISLLHVQHLADLEVHAGTMQA